VLRSLLDKHPEKRPSSAEEVIRLLGVAQARDYTGVVCEASEGYFTNGQFVDRDREMKVLVERAGKVRQTGQGWTVFIAGEGGSGKTRCMEEFRTRALLQGWRVFEAACLPSEDRAYGPFRRFLQWTDTLYSGETGKQAGSEIFRFDDHARSEEESHDLTTESAVGRFRDLITRELVRRVSNRPTVFMLHDFHWADEAAAAVLGYLISDIRLHPVLILVSFRAGEDDRTWLGKVVEQSLRQGQAEALTLEALSHEAVREMIMGMTGESAFADSVAPWVYRSSGGNPFFVEEILKQLAERGWIRREFGRWMLTETRLDDLEVPSGVAVVLQSRLDQLSMPARQIADWLAVSGRAVPEHMLKAMTGLSAGELAAGLQELVSRQIVRSGEGGNGNGVEFRHALIAEVIRGRLTASQRRKMHFRIGEVLEQRSDGERQVNELAYHFTEGRGGEKAIQYALQAAKACRAEFSNEAALQFYEYVLSHGRSLPLESRCEVALEAADACCVLGNAKRALQILKGHQNVVTERQSALLTMKFQSKLSRVFQFLGDLTLSHDAALRGLAALTSSGSSDEQADNVKAHLLSQLAFCNLTHSDTTQGLSLMKEALDAARSRQLIGHLNILLGGLLWVASDFRDGLRASLKAIQILEPLGAVHLLPMAYSHAAINLGGQGKHRTAVRYHERAVEIARQTRSKFLHVQALCNLAEAYCRSGEIARASEMSSNLLGLAQGTGNRALLLSTRLCAVEILIASSRYSEAHERLACLTKREFALMPTYLRAQALLYSAWLKVELGDLESAHGDLENLRQFKTSGKQLYEAELGEILEARVRAEEGEIAAAIDILKSVYTLAARKHWAYHMGAARLWLGELAFSKGNLRDAKVSARQALRLASAMPSLYLQARAHLLLGRVHLVYSKEHCVSSLGDRSPGSPDVFGAYSRCLSELEQAIRISENNGVSDVCWRAHLEMARLRNEQQEQQSACAHANRALEHLEEIQRRVPRKLLENYVRVRGIVQAKKACACILRQWMGTWNETRLSLDQLEGIQLRTLVRVSGVVNAIREIEPLLEASIDLFLEATQLQRAFVFLPSEDKQSLVVRKGRNAEKQSLTTSDGICLPILESVHRNGSPFVTTNAQADSRISTGPRGAAHPQGTILCAPLKTCGKTLGVMYADSRQSPDGVSDSSISFLATFCNLAAVAIDNALAHETLKREKATLEHKLRLARDGYSELIGRSEAMCRLRERIAIVANSPLDVLIYGESGTGKELVARALHRTGPRASGSFVALDCGSLTDTLAESELFGHRRGSFTGATENRVGLLESAQAGVIFLDEISNLPMRLQGKLLRVLQEREVRPIGDTRPRRIDAQIIAATNKDLRAEINKGRFREDLYHRLNVMQIRVPPLRERPDDVPLLLESFLIRVAQDNGGRVKPFSKEAEAILLAYAYPGNVRELIHIVESSYYLAQGRIIEVGDLPLEVRAGDTPKDSPRDPDSQARLIRRQIEKGEGTFNDLVRVPFLKRRIGREVVRRLIHRILVDTGGLYKSAFRLLGIPERDYSAVSQFLKRNDCYLDFRPYRRRGNR
jgi:transcriptional regulator with GAF, ATPase, and Fis domain